MGVDIISPFMMDEHEIQKTKEPILEGYSEENKKASNVKTITTDTSPNSSAINLKEWAQDFKKEKLKIFFQWKYFALVLFLGLVPSIVDLITHLVNGTTYLRGNNYQ